MYFPADETTDFAYYIKLCSLLENSWKFKDDFLTFIQGPINIRRSTTMDSFPACESDSFNYQRGWNDAKWTPPKV
jgi:hypothetical protein